MTNVAAWWNTNTSTVTIHTIISIPNLQTLVRFFFSLVRFRMLLHPGKKLQRNRSCNGRLSIYDSLLFLILILLLLLKMKVLCHPVHKVGRRQRRRRDGRQNIVHQRSGLDDGESSTTSTGSSHHHHHHQGTIHYRRREGNELYHVLFCFVLFCFVKIK